MSSQVVVGVVIGVLALIIGIVVGVAVIGTFQTVVSGYAVLVPSTTSSVTTFPPTTQAGTTTRTVTETSWTTHSVTTTQGAMLLASEGSTVATQLFNITWSSVNLMVILPLVAIAGALIAAVFVYLRYIA